jgi:hypothetical protein
MGKYLTEKTEERKNNGQISNGKDGKDEKTEGWEDNETTAHSYGRDQFADEFHEGTGHCG